MIDNFDLIKSLFYFKEANIDVHKNNPTILYIPKSLDNGKSN